MSEAPATAPAGHDLEVALLVAERLRSVDRVSATVRAIAAADGPPGWIWGDHTTASGFAGLAVLFGCLDRCRPDEGWDRVGHQHMCTAVAAAQRVRSLALGLAAGASGLAFTALLLAADGGRYQGLRRTLDQHLQAGVRALVDRLRASLQPTCPDLDVISGAAGVASYLLARPEQDRLTELRDELLAEMARCLAEHRLPRRGGGVDLGLAHGVPGIVAALAAAHRNGVEVPGLTGGLRTGAGWLAARRTAGRWGFDWPRDDRASDDPVLPTRAAWCYGTPGVARSLLLAGRSLGDQALVETALRALDGVRQRPNDQRQLFSPTFCHGYGGLAHLLHETGIETGDRQLVAEARRLLDRVRDAFDPRSAFGYRAVLSGGSAVDSPGLLDGAAGVAMVLLAAAVADHGAPTGLPGWDRLFLVR